MLENKYALYREKKISGLQIRFDDIRPLIDELSPKYFKKSILGYSEQENPIHLIHLGHGATPIVLWTQMHGDESTATKSMFDLFAYIQAEYHTEPVNNLLNRCSLYVVPMLNPDGAAVYTRENANGIDLNRDAVSLQSKEAQLLHNLIRTTQAQFAFNLHDQTSFYSVFGTANAAVMSFLAPAADESRSLTASRVKAMQVIASMYRGLSPFIPNHVGRYNDTFNANCFGDSFQKMGIPTMLIESGYFPGDEKREMTRKFHFIALLSGLFAIAEDNFEKEEVYFNIPMNKKNFYDVLLTNVRYKHKITDVAIRYTYQFKQQKLYKLIDFSDVLEGESLQNALFHKTIDAKGRELSSFS